MKKIERDVTHKETMQSTYKITERKLVTHKTIFTYYLIFNNNPYVHSQNTIKFGDKSVRSLGAQIWNSLPENMFYVFRT